ncbi:rRNA processing protein-like protein [Actinidia rufa]|uniref:rRNA processing protein-like protein n=1 Tax=Actinidia rufa TaxID=165716 RepID=A0A7J0GXF1_9ERIC|nr:rRNA processing protein-like protein [Actinidia rufa]
MVSSINLDILGGPRMWNGHKLSLDIDREQEVDVNDDLVLELAFYAQALEGTRQALLKFQSKRLPFLRPSDYHAEMSKSDGHMKKLEGRLLAEKRKIEKLKERAKQKEEEIESVKKWRKQRGADWVCQWW